MFIFKEKSLQGKKQGSRNLEKTADLISEGSEAYV